MVAGTTPGALGVDLLLFAFSSSPNSTSGGRARTANELEPNCTGSDSRGVVLEMKELNICEIERDIKFPLHLFYAIFFAIIN